MFLNKIRNIFSVPDTKFVSATNVARACKRGNVFVGNNVFAIMCPRLPGSSISTGPECARLLQEISLHLPVELGVNSVKNPKGDA